MAGQYFFKIDDKFLPLSGGTVSGNTYIQANLSANTLNIVDIPINDNSLFQILARNSSNGNVNYVDVQHIISAATSQDKYVTGATYNQDLDLLTISRNDSVTIDVTGITDTHITGSTYNKESGLLTLLDNATNSISIDGFFTGVTISNTLFVDENGDDSIGQKGRLDKPFKTLYGAKTASTSGDLIYVLPQTIVFDNSDSTGNQYNGIWQTELNLWKDGITYYFSPGVKINMFNQSVTGDDLVLFYPGSSTGETCTVLGYLQFEATGLGPNSSFGKSRYFLSDGNTDSFNFYSETKSLRSNSCEIVAIYESTNKCVFNLKSDEEYRYKTGGNVGSGAVYVLNNVDIDFYSYVKRRYYYESAFSFYLRGDCTTANINIDGEYMISLSLVLSLRDFKCDNVNVNIDDIYYQNAYTPFALYGSIVSTQVNSGGWTLNMNSNLYDYSENSLTTGLFWLNHPNNTINYKGTITTKTNSGTGRFIISSSSGNIINFDGDIKLLGTGTTSNVIIQSFGTSKVNFRGNIEGNFNYTFHPRFGGEINVNNSKITSTADRFILYDHTDTTTSTFRLNNSYVNGYNDLNSYGDGQYLNVLISNSNIVNTGVGNTLNNTTNFGRLQMVNSSIYSNSGLSINYPTTSEVITSNLTVNTDYSATTHSGEITKLTDLIY